MARDSKRQGFRLVGAGSRNDAARQAAYDVAVIGLGYVGLPLCLEFAKAGASVLGIDTDARKPEQLRAGRSYIKHIRDVDVARAVQGGKLDATTDVGAAARAEAVLICVPTPLTAHRTPDLSYVENTARALAPHLKPGHLIVLESTTYPGTTDEVIRPILEAGGGLIAGRDFHLAFSPEREDPGTPGIAFSDVPKVVGGVTPACADRAERLYRRIVGAVVRVPSCRVAEAAKLTENIFRAVNIALVNELKVIFTAMDIDVWDVIDAAATKPFGFMPFYPGPGLGGHCIPIDPFYLTWKALEYGQRTRLIELAGEINTSMPEYVVSRVIDALNDARKPARGSRILLLGLAYKANVDDDRESPAYAIMHLLEQRGAEMSYNDPHIPVIRPGRSHHAFAGRTSRPISAAFDVLVLCTAHDEYRDFDFASLGVPLVDCRNGARKPPAARYAA